MCYENVMPDKNVGNWFPISQSSIRQGNLHNHLKDYEEAWSNRDLDLLRNNENNIVLTYE